MSTETESLRLFLSELYGELRAYRDKEFQTFLFSFPVIGAGLLPDLSATRIKALLTLFGIAILYYIWANHYRMMRIKRSIVSIQAKLALPPAGVAGFELQSAEWKDKPWYRHTGTVLYSVLLGLEMIALWWVSS